MSSNWKARNERKARIAELKEEGRQAYREGRHLQAMPHHYLRSANRYWWEYGWIEARDEEVARTDPALRLAGDVELCRQALKLLRLTVFSSPRRSREEQDQWDELWNPEIENLVFRSET